MVSLFSLKIRFERLILLILGIPNTTHQTSIISFAAKQRNWHGVPPDIPLDSLLGVSGMNDRLAG